MKSTKIMLAVIGTFIATWMFLTTIGWLLSEDQSFRQVATSGGILIILFIFGWIPSMVVAIDLDQKLED
jgi:hypothetical protein